MPLTVKTGAMKVKDPSSGNYVDVDMSLGVDYAPINSPEFAGTPKAPTATSETNNTQIATTAFVQGLVSTEASARQAADSALQGSLNTIESAIAIVADGNTHAAIASGQYVYIKNHASLAEGLYKATAAIPLNGTLSSSVVVSANSALNTISNSVADIGTRAYWENGTNHNFDVPNDLDFDCGSITLASGRWLIIGTGDWASNAVGYRQISFASGKNPARQYTSTTQACESGKETFHQIVAFFESNGTEAVHLYARQNSGETIKIFPLLYAVKIGEYQ